jgi:hypothetical protein
VRRRDQIALGVAAVVAIAAVAWAGNRIVDRTGEPAAEVLSDDPGVAHVHGLGINPADGALIVATHYGSFRLAVGGDVAERLGDSYQDTMGFTVVGPDQFLGSGHPDVAGMRSGQPGRLGLVESSDGITWTNLSLGGEADFHALAFAHSRVYGWEAGSGQFMISTDRETWDNRSSIDLYGFAVDPDDAEHIIGAAPDGLIDSSDGGRSWTAATGPALVTLSWDPEVGLWGADASGAVYRRTGPDWERAGALPGQPQALLATPEALYAAAQDSEEATGIYRSTDGGRTWELRYRDPGQ